MCSLMSTHSSLPESLTFVWLHPTPSFCFYIWLSQCTLFIPFSLWLGHGLIKCSRGESGRAAWWMGQCASSPCVHACRSAYQTYEMWPDLPSRQWRDPGARQTGVVAGLPRVFLNSLIKTPGPGRPLVPASVFGMLQSHCLSFYLFISNPAPFPLPPSSLHSLTFVLFALCSILLYNLSLLFSLSSVFFWLSSVFLCFSNSPSYSLSPAFPFLLSH